MHEKIKIIAKEFWLPKKATPGQGQGLFNGF